MLFSCSKDKKERRSSWGERVLNNRWVAITLNSSAAETLLFLKLRCLVLEPRAAKWKAQIKPLRNGSTPLGYFCLFRFDVCVFVTSFSLIEWNSFFVVFELQFCFAHKLLFYLLCQGQKNKQQTNVKGWQTIGPVTTRRMGWGIYLKQL